MAYVRSLVACTCWLLLFPAVCSKITYRSSLVRAIGEDVVFKWNSTDPIIQAHWGTMYNNSDKIEFHIIDKYRGKPADIHADMNKFIYKNRIMFVGNLTDGRAWFKLTNLTIADTNYFGAYIISGPLGGQRPKVYSTYLKVQVVRFIQVPPNIQYVAKGQTATFSWDHFPVKKSIKLLSRRWQVYNSVNGWKTIGAEHSISGWQWKLSASCPARLKNPTRVSKASTASLVIYDVTIEDSGLYRCNLHLRGRPPVTSTTQLIVTVGPQFTSQPPPSKNIAEGHHLKLLCSAVGQPTPNVTWVLWKDDSMVTVSRGVGNAVLSIPNISRKQTGKYECQAANNPNQGPVTAQTSIHVMYKPSIHDSDSKVTSSPGTSITLRCRVSGYPSPNVTWYTPYEELISKNVMSRPGLSKIVLNIKNAQDYGTYKCRVENIMGYSEQNITVLACDRNRQSRKPISDGIPYPVFIACVIFIVVLLVVVVAFVKKSCPQACRTSGRCLTRLVMK